MEKITLVTFSGGAPTKTKFTNFNATIAFLNTLTNSTMNPGSDCTTTSSRRRSNLSKTSSHTVHRSTSLPTLSLINTRIWQLRTPSSLMTASGTRRSTSSFSWAPTRRLAPEISTLRSTRPQKTSLDSPLDKLCLPMEVILEISLRPTWMRPSAALISSVPVIFLTVEIRTPGKRSISTTTWTSSLS
ncbi:hypothetical protein L596_016448 [Steinernema carpocapsae]|uniref:Uncharacterized protein n=1 Tax=Steinernema carpocapsae TaxID=34508 RepID=A0A4U5NI42_STECR|nr:hypothetical protein L596_016448 [Steinernema carpocapsae]